MNAHMRARDPFERAKTETVTVEVHSVLPVSPQTWRVEWREETRKRDGTEPVSTEMQATITLAFAAPADEATLRLNPSGLYVNAFNWAERL
jgi:type IV secretion system protein TrbF